MSRCYSIPRNLIYALLTFHSVTPIMSGKPSVLISDLAATELRLNGIQQPFKSCLVRNGEMKGKES